MVSASCEEEKIIEEEKKPEEVKKIEEITENIEKEPKKPNITYIDFAPCLFQQNQDKNIKIFESFNEGLDAYFAAMENKSERVEFEQKAWKKYENIKV